jgi:surface antigen
MPEDRFGVSGRMTERRKRLASRLNRRNRRLLAAGLPLMAIAAAALPTVLSHVTAKSAAQLRPSYTLCAGWIHCTRMGYPSYHYQTRGFRSYWRMSAGDQCTNYAAYVESTVYHVREPRFLLGNGGQWAATAAAHGIKVNHTPSVGAVAEWDGGAPGMSSAGHVAVVEAVGPRHRYIVISQQHIGGQRNDYDWTLIRAHRSAEAWQTWPSHFIHFRIPRRADVGYYNRWTGKVSERYSQTSGPANAKPRIGRGLIPLAGDWSGHGPDRLGYYNPRYGTFALFGARGPNSTANFKFGPPHMIPLVGDWTGAGHDGIGYYDWKTGTFYLREQLYGGKPLKKFRFGPKHMIPLAGHWTSGRRSGVGYYNPRTGFFALRNTLSAGPAFRKFRFGPDHMVPLAGSWAGQRWDGVGYYNRWNGTFHLRESLGRSGASVTIRFGPRKMVPLTGEWFGV